MGWKEVPAGKHLATANQARFGESRQKGTLFIEVEFQLKEIPEKLIWTGYMTEKTTQRTLDSMALIDWNGDDTFAEGSFSTDKVIQLVVELEAGNDGVQYPRVKWVNDPSKQKFEGLEAATIKQKLGGINLKAEMASAKARLNIKPVAAAEKKADVPF